MKNSPFGPTGTRTSPPARLHALRHGRAQAAVFGKSSDIIHRDDGGRLGSARRRVAIIVGPRRSAEHRTFADGDGEFTGIGLFARCQTRLRLDTRQVVHPQQGGLKVALAQHVRRDVARCDEIKKTALQADTTLAFEPRVRETALGDFDGDDAFGHVLRRQQRPRQQITLLLECRCYLVTQSLEAGQPESFSDRQACERRLFLATEKRGLTGEANVLDQQDRIVRRQGTCSFAGVFFDCGSDCPVLFRLDLLLLATTPRRPAPAPDCLTAKPVQRRLRQGPLLPSNDARASCPSYKLLTTRTSAWIDYFSLF